MRELMDGDHGMLFEPWWQTLGLDFGRQVMLRFYNMKRTNLEELQRHLERSGSGKGKHRKREKEKAAERVGFLNAPAFVYRQTSNSKGFQKAWKWMTLGTSTTRSKIVVFFFDDEEAKEHAVSIWPSQLKFCNVQSSLIRKLGQYEYARYRIRKGMLTFYLYAVKKTNTRFEKMIQFQELKFYIENS